MDSKTTRDQAELDGMPERPPEPPTKFGLTNVGKFRLRDGIALGDDVTLIIQGTVIHHGYDQLETGGEEGDGEPNTRPAIKIRATSINER